MKRLTIAILAVLASVCACGSPPVTRPATSTYTGPPSPEPSQYQFPTKYAGNFTVVWSAEPSIDLFSRPAEIVRATGEADAIRGVPSSLNYPGAVDANAVNKHGGVDRSMPPWSGTLYFHILRLNVAADAITATTCRTEVGVVNHGVRGPDSLTRGIGYLFSFSARLPRGGSDPRASAVHATTSGRGDRAPRYNAFAPWQVTYTAVVNVYNPPSDSDEARCDQKAVDIARTIPAYKNQRAEFPELEPRGYTDADFPRQPQFPGWPAP